MFQIRLAAFVLGFVSATFIIVAAARATDGSEPPLLKEQISVSEDVVRLQDLFENAGANGSKPVFRSPDLGREGSISAERVREAAARHGLQWPNLGRLKRVMIRREARVVGVEQLKGVIVTALGSRYGDVEPNLIDINYSGKVQPMFFPANSDAPVVVKSLQHNESGGSFRAVLGLDDDNTKRFDRIYRGRAFKMTTIYVPRKTILPGVTISQSDLKPTSMKFVKLRGRSVAGLEQIVGKAPKRRLLADRPIFATDLQEPQLVQQNGLVDILYNRNGLSLKAEGRALQSGSLGDTVKVVNTHSRKKIIATVTGSGRVSVSRPGGPEQKNISPSIMRPSKQVAKALPSAIRNGWEAVYKVR